VATRAQSLLYPEIEISAKRTRSLPAQAGKERWLVWKPALRDGYGNPPYLAGMETRPTRARAARVEIEHNRFMGIGNQINVALKAESLVDRDDRRAALTSAWFVDLRTAGFFPRTRGLSR